MLIEPTQVAEAALYALEHPHFLRRTFLRLRRLIKVGQLEIVVYGPGGVGKTTLGTLVASGFDPDAAPSRYEESIDIDQFDLAGDAVGLLLVAPGQELRRDTHWPDLLRRTAAGRSRGVINVVAYGMHSFQNLSYKNTGYFRAGMTEHEFMEVYTESRRRDELNVIRTRAPHLKAAPGRLWMITLVTKQDLWWKDRLGVELFYEQGQYNEASKKSAACAVLSISCMNTCVRRSLPVILPPRPVRYSR